MPTSFSKNNSKNLTIITLHGEVTIKEFFQVIDEYKNSGYSKYEIYDLQNFTGEPLTFNEVRNLANYIYDLEPMRPKGGKTAVIHNHSDQMGFGITRQLIALLESENVYFELNAFYSMKEAFQWLSIPSETNHHI